MKILHSGDWHLDSPMSGHSTQQREFLQNALLRIPEMVASVCRREGAELVLLTGDLFDGAYTQHSYRTVYAALEQMGVPVFISPGNHDYIQPESPWIRELWPENVHIFKKDQVESVAIPELDCRVYGAAFTQMDCPALLKDFRAEGSERYSLGCFHADPTLADSPYNPVTRQQVAQSGLTYLALGHIHKGDSFRAGDTLCAWPGCPMGTGYDEDGLKGVLSVQIDRDAKATFVPLELPRFYDLTVPPETEPEALLPAVPNGDFYRLTFVGQREKPDLAALQERLAAFPNLVLQDHTVPVMDLWAGAGTDSFAGLYFGMLKAEWEQASPDEKEKLLLAAQFSRQILMGQEVRLP